MSNYTKVYLDPNDAEQLLYGMQQLCNGMSAGVFGWTVGHVMSANDKLTETENAYDFVAENYDTIAGAFRIMAAATNIICTCITNDELHIAPGNNLSE